MRQRLLADDPIRQQRAAALARDDAGAEVVVEHVAVSGADGAAVELRELLPYPLDVLAARARKDRKRSERRRFPEQDEWTVPVVVHLAQREDVAAPSEVERGRLAV